MNTPMARLLLVVFVVVAGAGFFVLSNSSTSDDLIAAAGQSGTPTPGMENPKIIGWDDLMPEGETAFLSPDASTDFSEFDDVPYQDPEPGTWDGPMSIVPQMNGSPVPELADTAVKLAGYMTPLDVEGGKTKLFLLVPYVGACIHVPAPPSNQIVLVETKQPIEVKEMWEPFEAIGMLRVKNVSTDLADVAYTMELDRTEPYVDDLEDMDQST